MKIATGILTFLLCSCSLFSVVKAEKQREAVLDESIGSGKVSHGLVGTIHGSGRVDFAKVHYDFESSVDATVTAALAVFPNKKEIIKYQNWETQDTASSRFNRDQYLAQQGIGAMGKDGEYYACCTDKAVQAEACDLSWSNILWGDDDEEMYNVSLTGNMILSPKARFRLLDINETLDSGNDDESDLGMHGVMWFGETRQAALFFANCNASDAVHIHGTVVWTSFISASTLPLYVFLAFCHGALCLWYRERMNKNKDSRIQVEEWIFFTLFLATVAIILKTIYYGSEAFADEEWLNLSFAAEFSKSIARAVSRCLYLLLAMGVGVTAPGLESTRIAVLIAIFLALYIYTNLGQDLLIYGIFVPFFESVMWLHLILSLIFMIWIPVSIKNTMRFLEFRNETHKLERYRMIWNIYLLAILLGVMEVLIWIVDMQLNAGRDYDWMTQGEQEDITYLIIIACMASLWKPNPSQQMYSYQLLGDDGDMETPANMSLELSEQPGWEDENELQLSATPSL